MHRATPEFWQLLDRLPDAVQSVARQNFELLKANPRHPSLRLRRVGAFWSVRVGRSYRALAVPDGENFIWVWIGTHIEYDKLIRP